MSKTLYYRFVQLTILFGMSALLIGCTPSSKDADSSSSTDANGMFQSLLKSAQQGDAEAQFKIGTCYMSGHSSPMNKQDALEWFDNYCSQETTSAANESDRKGVLQDKSEAVLWFLKAAEQGNADAQVLLGEIYFEGFGVSENKKEGIKWVRKAVEKGDSDAMLILGECYLDGEGVPEDKNEGIEWIRKSVDKNNSYAMWTLGGCYLFGDGVPKDKKEGIKLIRAAVEMDNACAMWTLGECYLTGNGVPEDKEEGLLWIRKAAEKGYCPSIDLLNNSDSLLDIKRLNNSDVKDNAMELKSNLPDVDGPAADNDLGLLEEPPALEASPTDAATPAADNVPEVYVAEPTEDAAEPVATPDADDEPLQDDADAEDIDDLFGDDAAPAEDAPAADDEESHQDNADAEDIDDLFGDDDAAPAEDAPAADDEEPHQDDADAEDIDDLFGDDVAAPAEDAPRLPS